MLKIISVTFLNNNKKYYFSSIPGVSLFDKVVVETARGLELGTAVEIDKEIEEKDVVGELKPVLRKADERDIKNFEENQALKPELQEKCKEIIAKSGLEMKFLDAEYTLDKSKLVIYFSADGRVDFRDLVKDVASIFKTRIELRQVGPRDASRIISGIGQCGRKLCCSQFLGDIQNVTIKMAKNQNLTLNPTAISGLCGKLLCCIAYEDDVYTSIKRENGIVEEENS